MQSMGDAFALAKGGTGLRAACGARQCGPAVLSFGMMNSFRRVKRCLHYTGRGAISRRAELDAGRQAMHRRSACGRDTGCKVGLQSTHPLSAITAERRVNLPRRRSAGVPKPPPRIHRARAALMHYPDIRPTPEDPRQSIVTISYSRRPSPSAAAASMVCMP